VKTIYYFVSDKNFDGQILYPRIPYNRMDNEDDEIERICVSQSIDGCLLATYYGLTDIVYVHSCESDKVISPTIKQVPDTPFTGEQWIIEPVKMKLFITIKITQIIKREFHNMPMDIYCYKIME